MARSRWNNLIFGDKQDTVAPVAPTVPNDDRQWLVPTNPSRRPSSRPAGGCSGRGGCSGSNTNANSELAKKRALLAWQNDRNLAATRAGIEAQDSLGKKQRTLIKNSGKLLTDFERQEKRRFLEAKKGVGQVSEEDFALTVEERDKAKAYLEQGSDYWKVKMDEVYNLAKKNAFDNYEKFNFKGR